MAPTVPTPRHLPSLQQPTRQVSERAGRGGGQAQLPTGGFGRLASATGQVAAAGRGMLNPVQDLMDKSLALAENLAVMDADNQLAEIDREIRSSLADLKGKDAIGAADRKLREYDERSKEVLDGLFTIRSTQGAMQAHASRGRSLSGFAEQYESRQVNAYADETETKTIANAVFSAQGVAEVREPGWEKEYAGLRAKVGQVMKQRQARLGQDDQTFVNAWKNQDSKMHLQTIVNQLKSDDVEGAREFFAGDIKKSMLPAHRAEAEALIGREHRKVKINTTVASAIEDAQRLATEKADQAIGELVIDRQFEADQFADVADPDTSAADVLSLIREKHAEDPLLNDYLRAAKVQLSEIKLVKEEEQAGHDEDVLDFVWQNRRSLANVDQIPDEMWGKASVPAKKAAVQRLSSYRSERRSIAALKRGLPMKKTPGHAKALDDYLQRTEQARVSGHPVGKDVEKELERDVFPRMHPSDIPRARKDMQNIARAHEKGTEKKTKINLANATAGTQDDMRKSGHYPNSVKRQRALDQRIARRVRRIAFEVDMAGGDHKDFAKRLADESRPVRVPSRIGRDDMVPKIMLDGDDLKKAGFGNEESEFRDRLLSVRRKEQLKRQGPVQVRRAGAFAAWARSQGRDPARLTPQQLRIAEQAMGAKDTDALGGILDSLPSLGK